MGLNEVALGLTLGIATFTDWRDHKIYNKLLVPAFSTALLLHAVQRGVSGLTSSLWGGSFGFVLLLLPYLMGGMGAGDVKLLAVIGAFGGAPFVLKSFFCGTVVGGIIAILLLVRQRALGNTLKHFLLFSPILRKPEHFSETMKNAHQETFPYGIAIAIGTLLAMFLPLGGEWS